MLQIVAYNWPTYVVGAAVCALALALITWIPLPAAVRSELVGAACLAGFWLLASLGASYWVYDHSELTRWQWIPGLLSRTPTRWANLHAGLDETSVPLLHLFPGTDATIVDLYDPAEMTEPSIRRARRLTAPSVPAERAEVTALPFEDEQLDAVFLIFAAHEVRIPSRRRQFFQELRRVLRPGGSILLVEHLRDLPNFVAFGPGFMHFHARRVWLELARDAGLAVSREARFTPFVGVFLLEKLA